MQVSQNLIMGNEIWGTLTDYEGRWVAVDRQGRVVAHAGTLADVMREAGAAARRLTFLYAAPAEAAAGSFVRARG